MRNKLKNSIETIPEITVSLFDTIDNELEMNIREAINVLRLHKNMEKYPSKLNLDKREFNCNAQIDKRIFYISMNYVINATKKDFYYIVDTKYKKCYQISDGKTIDMDTKENVEIIHIKIKNVSK